MSAGPLVGTEFAGYRVEAVIGRGGMSAVYRAQHPRLGSSVALKVLAPQLSEHEGFRERFVRESRLAASISHPNVIPIHDAGYQGDVLYIVMRYVSGSDLRHVLARHGPLSLADSARIVGQACRGLHAAHERELVHRDVKPANLLLEVGDDDIAAAHVYVADFGVSKDIGSLSLASTASSGTVGYMSPEQIEGGPVDRRTDVYSLGCVLYECLCGTPPFAKESVAATLWAQMQEDPEPVTARRTDLPHEVDRVIANAMAKRPEDRYSGCAELARDLEEAAAGAPVHTARPSQAAGTTPRRRWGMVIRMAVALVAVAAVAAGAATMLGSGDGNTTGSSPSGSTSPLSGTPQRPTSLQTLLRQADLSGCSEPTPLKNAVGERVGCSYPAPALSFLTVALYRDEHWGPLASQYANNVEYYMGKDPNLRAMNSGRCGPQPELWEHEDAWRVGAPQLNIPFNPFDMKAPRVVGRVLCWTGTTGRPQLEWTLLKPGVHLIAVAFGNLDLPNPQARLYRWWSHARNELAPAGANS